MKKCTRCKEYKKEEYFNNDKHSKDGKTRQCRACRCEVQKNNKKYHKVWKDSHREEFLEYQRKYKKNNAEKVRLSSKASREKNKHSLTCKFACLKGGAVKRNLEVNMTLAEYSQVIGNKICYYCDEDFSLETGGNLNRINNNIGYNLSNVRPCCKICNKIMNVFSKKELSLRVYKIVKRMD